MVPQRTDYMHNLAPSVSMWLKYAASSVGHLARDSVCAGDTVASSGEDAQSLLSISDADGDQEHSKQSSHVAAAR